jgi:hypothetical protein
MNKDTPMSENFTRFIKFIPSERSRWLQRNHPWAFLLLLTIAERARRLPNSPDGLQIGEAFVGDFENYGIPTRATYRHALEVLKKHNFIQICETCRTRKKATTVTTTVGTKVKIIDSSVWDVNLNIHNHRNDHLTTTNKKEERKKKEITPPNPLAGEAACAAEEGYFASLHQRQEECTYLDEQGIRRFKHVGLPPDHELHHRYHPEEEHPNSEAPIVRLTIHTLTSDNITSVNNNIFEKKKSKKREVKNFAEDSEPMILSRHFLSLIKKRKKDFKEPNLQKWATTIDLMLSMDQRKPEDIKQVMEWAILDEFWCPVVMCIAKLRRYFDTLQLKSQKVVKPAAFQAKAGMIDSNRQLAQTIDRKFQGTFKSWKIEVYQDSIAFYMGAAATTFKFTEHGFQDQVLNAMRKWGMPIDGLNAPFRTEIGLESRKVVG